MVGNKAQKAVAAALTGMMVLGSAAPAFAGTKLTDNNNKWYRLDGTYKTGNTYDGAMISSPIVTSGTVDGQDRYDTMLDMVLYNVNRGKYTEGKVVLVSGEKEADALSAAGLAGILKAPVVTTPGDKLGEQAKLAIEYIALQNAAAKGTVRVYIVGGESAVSSAVEDAVKALDDSKVKVTGTSIDEVNGAEQTLSVTVDREMLSGSDRSATSLQVAKRMAKFMNQSATAAMPDFANAVFVANGTAWADALSVGSFAYVGETPILLTQGDGSLTADQLDYISDLTDPKIYIIGGKERVQPAVNQIDALVDMGTYKWLKGDDRYETNAAVLKAFKDKFGAGDPIAVATGENWPDALVGGAFIGANDGALVLVGDADYAAVKQAKDSGYVANNTNNYVLGGKKVVTEGQLNIVWDVLGK